MRTSQDRSLMLYARAASRPSGAWTVEADKRWPIRLAMIIAAAMVQATGILADPDQEAARHSR
jgi:hypothetical protein